jgi:DNA-binding beta-propeller fold protein YncE
MKKERGNGEDQISDPRGISFDDKGNVILTDSGNNRVDCYTKNGERLWRIDEFSLNGEKQSLKNPSRAIMWKGYIAVADSGNDRICLVPHPQREKPSLPRVIDGFATPKYVTSDDKGRLIVSDSGDGSIKVYDERLQPLNSFTGTSEKKLAEPIGVAPMGDGGYAVVDSAAKTIVFTTEKMLIYGSE